MKERCSTSKNRSFPASQHGHIMVENLNIQKVLAPISLTSKVKKASGEKSKNRQRPFEEELKEKKKKMKGCPLISKKQMKKQI